MNEANLDPEVSLPFPIEFLIRGTPRSHQGKNSSAKEQWKQKVAAVARAHVQALREFVYLDRRVLAVTLFYFPPAAMEGDIDNIVKPIVDAMATILYPDDQLLERITVQKFEPEVSRVFRSLTPTLEQASKTEPPTTILNGGLCRDDENPTLGTGLLENSPTFL